MPSRHREFLATHHPITRRVHLAAGLPTPSVVAALEQIRAEVPARSFAEFLRSPLPASGEMTVILPPYIENSRLIEDWESCDYVPGRLGEGAGIANVITVVDADFLADQMASAHPLSAYGWGKTAYDARSVADIVVGQIESATHILVVGRSGGSAPVDQVLGALNPKAPRCSLDNASPSEFRDFLVSSRWITPSHRAAGEWRGGVVPPWLAMLEGDEKIPESGERFLYRRTAPFDRELFREWLADPPCELIRGKGKIWLADENSWAFGYSCAGAVHRVFPVGAWWADQPDGAWPQCETQRQRLLDRWHPQFGDRRQEIAFIGVDLDVSRVRASLDACLISEDSTLESMAAVSLSGDELSRSASGLDFH